MNNKPLYIFDLDGTLADNQHRQHLLPNWKAFFEACYEDTPIKAVVTTLEMLFDDGAEIWIWSGRSDAVEDLTKDWLEYHLNICEFSLKMRPAGDHRPDDLLKQEWLIEMSFDDRKRLVAVFDDRDKVVKMWRENGVRCFQVAPGDF